MKYRESFEYLGTGWLIIVSLEMFLAALHGFQRFNWVLASLFALGLLLYFLFVTKATYFELKEKELLYTTSFFYKKNISYESIVSLKREKANLQDQIFGSRVYVGYSNNGKIKELRTSIGFKRETLLQIAKELKNKNPKIEVAL